ncbi:carboxypeptidase S [Wolfiporia cocos MD-104 SS10]|uniref:Carboxypeptidase S n=1 Tax=Wolfiporia cocos (strain MD-104) TaxID=742152 RepID=A0A2H3JIY7_WOLCO|nr:carboxypeptidase S [Wolfiporia cocos MD-104 SS10]
MSLIDVNGSLCYQSAPLQPSQNRELWSAIQNTLVADTYLNRSAALLGGSIRIPTEVYDEMGPIGDDPSWTVFGQFHDYLLASFPQTHASLRLTTVNTYGLVYHWQGSNESLKPLLLTAHQDVVPVNPDTFDEWEHPPYSGYYDGTFIWGRGSIDDKSSLISIMTAVETLLKHRFHPTRTIVIAFGFDEEASGLEGASAISRYLLSEYGENAFSMLVDEGGAIETQYGGVFALPAIAEKGYLDVQLDVSAPGGHSSVPPPHTTIGMLASMLVAYEASAPSARLQRDSPMYTHAQCLAAHAPDLPARLREAIVGSATSDSALRRAEKELLKDATFRALISTTQAVDLIAGGVKANALPERATAVVNHRIATDSSVAAVQERTASVLKPIAARYNLSLTAFGVDIDSEEPSYGKLTLSDPWKTALEPAPITPAGPHDAPFQLLSGTIKATYDSHRASPGRENVNVIPSLGSGNTDTQFYWKLTPHIFRYSHYIGGPGSGMDKIHTVNEACLADSLVEMIRFYILLILNADESNAI